MPESNTPDTHQGWLEENEHSAVAGASTVASADRSAERDLDYVMQEIARSAEEQLQAAEEGREPETVLPVVKQADLPAVDLTTTRPFRVVPTPRKIAMAHMFSERTGLRTDQFAMNSWGFPPMPIPSPTWGNGRVRLAPPELHSSYMGHPIYWIDPELTQRRDNETLDMWSIRMYYLILAMGLWHNTEGSAQWVNYPGYKGISWEQSDADAYHHVGNPPTVFDQVPLLTKADLVVDEQVMRETHDLTIASITESVKSETLRYSELQVEALTAAKQILGWPTQDDLPYETPVPLHLKGSLWDSKIKPELISALDEYVQVKLKMGRVSSDEVSQAYRYLTNVLNETTLILLSTDYVIGMLSIPSSSSALNASNYASWISLLNMTLHSNDERTQFYNFENMIDLMANGTEAQLYYAGKTMDDIQRSTDDPASEAFATVRDLMENSCDRLRLELLNHKRGYMGLPRIDSLGHMYSLESRAQVDIFKL